MDRCPLNYLHHGILAELQLPGDISVRPSLGPQLQHPGLIAVSLDSLTRLSPKLHPTRTCCRDTRAHPFPQQITLELRQRCHQRGEELALGGAQIELQSGLRDHAHPAGFQVLQAAQQVGRGPTPAGQFRHQHGVGLPIPCHHPSAGTAIVLAPRSRFLKDCDHPIVPPLRESPQVTLLAQR